MFHKGSNVEIRATDNVLSRFPDLVGKRATVVASPTHPSTWFSIKVEETNQVIKLQPTAMTLIDEAGGSEVGASEASDAAAANTMSRSGSTASLAHDDSSVQYDGGHQRAKSMGHVVHCSLAPAMKKGCSVTILRTENVLQRAPHLVGREGIVKEAPVHPATWFKVEFPDKSVFTFRPSALVITADIPKDVPIDWSYTLGSPQVSRARHNSSENDDSGEKSRRKRKRSEKLREADGTSPGAKDDDDGTEEEEEATGDRRGRRRAEPLLTSVDPDAWPGMVVRVKGSSRTGTVLKTGNGWVQVNTSTGEIAKRAYELQVVSSGDRGSSNEEGGRSSRNSRAGASSSAARSQETTNIRIGSYSRTSTAPSLHIQIDCAPVGRPRSYSEPLVFTPTEAGGMSYYGISSPKLFLSSSPRAGNTFSFSPKAGVSSSSSEAAPVVADKSTAPAAGVAAEAVSKTTEDSATSSSSSGATSTAGDALASSDTVTSESAASTGDAAAAVGEGEGEGEKKKEYFIKKANPLLLQARKEYIQKYVSRTQEKLENRPDLAFWKRSISSSIMVDTKFELDVARREVDECLYYCPCCLMERWEGGMFCWNENCKESPIYWKLPGTRGKPLTPRKPKPVVTTQVVPESGGAPTEVTRRVSNKKWSVNLIDNVPSVNGNNENYLSYHKNDDCPSAARPGKDTQEYHYYYEHPNPKIPRVNPIVSDDLQHKPFAQLLDGVRLSESGDKQPVVATPAAVTDLNLSTVQGHSYYDNNETNKLCPTRSIFVDENEMDDENCY
jgi:hypothetical protein